MKRVASILVAVLLLATSAGFVWQSLARPYAGFDGAVLLQIERGTSSREMAALLAAGKVIRYEWQFLAVRALRPKTILRAGEYRFDRPASAWEVFDRIARGDIFYHSVTVPEGSNIFDVTRIVAQLDWVTEQETLELVKDPAPILDLAPGARTLEGYLFPSTYHVSRGTSAADIIRMMTGQFRKVWARIGGGTGVHDTVTLASLVEKETGIPEERPLVASVYRNRLERGMKLECDPTAIYAALLEGSYRGAIHRSDLDSDHPYNTYQHAGLPPGPIANPGRESLRAALEPERTGYLYFVAKPDGSGAHEFSKTYSAHRRAAARYRDGLRQAKRQNPPRGVPQQ